MKATTSMALALTLLAAPASAQQVWLQIEARASESSAVSAAQDYAQDIDQVVTFEIGNSSWYAIAVGPFSPEEAETRRRELRGQRLIPGDSFTSLGNTYGEPIWPEGVQVAQAGPAEEDPIVLSQSDAATLQGTPQPEEQAQAEPTPEPEPAPVPEETPAEARRSEAELSREEKAQLQIALRWAGFYDAAIDSAFGRGTRGAMSDWQESKGYETTGVLTTRQRAELIADYNSVFDGLGLQPVTDSTAGITMKMPTALVEFARYMPPFAHYDPVEGADPQARLLLISQEGQRADLNGLYDIMQTLDIVPREGERERRQTGFTLIGENDEIVSQTETRLEDGQIKGFTLIWPAGDEQRRQRVVDEMIASFTTNAAQVMPDVMGTPGEDQSVDLVAGLTIRKPAVVRSGFYVSRRGDVLTTADAAQSCERITLDNDTEATVSRVDEETGLALLRPETALAPRQHATFRDGVPLLNSDVILAGYSYDGQLGAPSLTYGSLAAMTGLDGEDDVRRYDLESRSGDAGGPVFDLGGEVLGLLQSAPTDGRSLPQGVSFATDAEAIRGFLSGAGVNPTTAGEAQELPRGQIERRATDITVLVGCWK